MTGRLPPRKQKYSKQTKRCEYYNVTTICCITVHHTLCLTMTARLLTTKRVQFAEADGGAGAGGDGGGGGGDDGDDGGVHGFQLYLASSGTT